ncbi:MAG: PAS domain-containing protein [Pseudomonadota bacterium]
MKEQDSQGSETAQLLTTELSRILLDDSPALLWVCNAVGEVFYVNSTWRNFTGQTIAQASGEGWLTALHPEDREATKSVFLKAVNDQQAYDIDYRLLSAGGDSRYFHANGSPYFDARGQLLGYVGSCMDIDSSTRARHELGELQERLELVVEAVTDLIWDWNRIGSANETFWMSRRISTILGYRSGEIELEIADLETYVHPDDENAMAMARRDGFAKDYYTSEFRARTKEGRYKWLRSHAAVIRDDDGQVVRMCGSSHDIDEEKQVEIEVEELQHKYELAVSGSQVGLWDWDLISPDLWISPSYRQMLGYQGNETFDDSAKFIENHVHPDDRTFVREAIRSAIKRGHHYDIEYRMRHASGEYRWYRGRGHARRGTNGRAIRMSGSAMDINLRKQAELALTDEKEKAQITLTSIGEGVITTDSVGRIDFLNPAAEELLGVAIHEIRYVSSDYLFSLFDEETGEALPDPIAQCAREKRTLRSDSPKRLLGRHGEELAIEYSVSPIRLESNRVSGIVFVFKDVTEQRRMAREISYQATHDALTDLVNRRAFEERLERLIKAGDRGSRHALCYLDLDRFKVVNDSCGHIAGDELLRQISSILRAHTRSRDTIGRLGGDEFALLLEHCDMGQARRIAEQIRTAVAAHKFQWNQRAYSVGVSIGIVKIQGSGQDVASVLQDADAACYTAKDLGRNQLYVYKSSNREIQLRRGDMEWVAKIQDALHDDGFELFYQRVKPMGELSTDYHEILLRYKDEDGDYVLPGRFLPTANRYGLATTIDHWVFDQLVNWYEANTRNWDPKKLFAVNLSALSLSDQDFKEFVVDRLELSGFPAHQICFEITETAAIENLTAAYTFFNELGEIGCQFALDDFGSGVSSFGYLRKLPIDFVKIDGGFVRDCADDPIARAMVKSINDIGQVMGKKTIAEFACSAEVVAALKELDIDFAQGFALHEPEPLASLGGTLERSKKAAQILKLASR